MKGQCLCGIVEFEVIGEIPYLYQCHCSECRKATGSSANAATFVTAENFKWISGEDKISSYRKPSGYRNDFCSVCGSTIPNPLRNTDKVWVPAGLLEESNDLKVAVHLYMGSRASWERTAQDAERYDESPGVDALNTALHPTSALSRLLD
jgi:hypothetical protein